MVKQPEMNDEGTLCDSSNNRWLTEAMDAVHISFVSSADDFDECEMFGADFVHQHFGEKETIFGYEGLSINLFYAEASMYIYPEITNEREISSVEKDMKGDDILQKLKDQLPDCQMNTMVESKEKFQMILKKQANFKPYGELLKKFTSGDKQFELYKISASDPGMPSDPEGFDMYLARVQTLALWYIDAAQYTDNSDPLWLHYFLFETRPSVEGDGKIRYSLAGYVSIYRFYAYPVHERPRIAHMMLLPQYRAQGNGAKLLQSVYNDIWTMKTVRDITVEDPADLFVALRDYVDCVNCMKLPEFAPEKLKQGFCDEMKDIAQEKFKLNRRQVRRAYEILRLMVTNVADAEEMKAYRLDVKRRLEAPVRRDQRDWVKLTKTLDSEELSQLAATQLTKEQKLEQLQKQFEQCVEEYRRTIDRIKTYPEIF